MNNLTTDPAPYLISGFTGLDDLRSGKNEHILTLQHEIEGSSVRVIKDGRGVRVSVSMETQYSPTCIEEIPAADIILFDCLEIFLPLSGLPQEECRQPDSVMVYLLVKDRAHGARLLQLGATPHAANYVARGRALQKEAWRFTKAANWLCHNSAP